MDIVKKPNWYYYYYFWSHFLKYRHARPIEGDVLYFDFEEQMASVFKYFVHPVERGEKGKGTERFFAGQDLSFASKDGFVEKSAFTISAGGDLLPSEHIRPDNTTHVWDEVRDFFFDADLVTANLESPFAETAGASYVPNVIMDTPIINSRRDIFDRIVDDGKGINFLSTANNHALDAGVDGLLSTLDFLDAKGYPHVGTSRSAAERDRPVIVERNGIKVAFIAFTYSINEHLNPENQDYLVNHVRLNHPGVDIGPIQKQAAAARAAGADLVVACLHWSFEYQAYPRASLIDTGHRIIESGVDVILGNHAHHSQPIECYDYTDSATGETKKGLIFYALGELFSAHQPSYNSRLGNLAKFRVSKGEAGGKPSVRITSLEILPVYLYRDKKDNFCRDYRVLDMRRLVKSLQDGRSPFEFSKEERKAIFRLDRLMNKILGPALK